MRHVGIKALSEMSLVTLQPAFDAAFVDYHLPLTMTVAGLGRMIAQESVNPEASRVVIVNDAPVGFALIGVRGWTARVAVMGVIPSERDRGHGSALLAEVRADATAKGLRQLTLEVIVANEAARRLYERNGFVCRRLLLSHAGQLPTSRAGDVAVAVDAAALLAPLAAWGDAALPWQLTAPSLAACPPPVSAYQLNGTDAYVLVSASPASPVSGGGDGKTMFLRGLVVAPEQRRRGLGRRVIAAAGAALGASQVFIPALVPEGGNTAFLRALGLKSGAIAQWEMGLLLPS